MKYILIFALFLIIPEFAFANGGDIMEWAGHFWKNIAMIIPTSAADSINPCAFAVMILLLSSILKQQKSKLTVFLSGLLFTLSIFISYSLMWLWIMSAIEWVSIGFINSFKLFIWILWIIIGLANLKDYFWYWKYFRMEVPTSWRPQMKKVLKRATSPIWAFFIGFLISLFLLPCTAGPYFVILGVLGSESANITNNWINFYIVFYNLIFILPMLVIAVIMTFGWKDKAELEELKELNVEKIHLITGSVMLLLWIYVILDVSGIISMLLN